MYGGKISKIIKRILRDMIKISQNVFFYPFLLLITFLLLGADERKLNDQDNILFYIADPSKDNVQLFWKDDKGNILKNFDNLQKFLIKKEQKLIFAMNGGMFLQDHSPQGLYIENFKTLKSLNSDSGYGNFYLKPNGIFYINGSGKPAVCRTDDFKPTSEIEYATQSGPMLLIEGRYIMHLKKVLKTCKFAMV